MSPLRQPCTSMVLHEPGPAGGGAGKRGYPFSYSAAEALLRAKDFIQGADQGSGKKWRPGLRCAAMTGPGIVRVSVNGFAERGTAGAAASERAPPASLICISARLNPSVPQIKRHR